MESRYNNILKRLTLIVSILLVFVASCAPSNEPPLDEWVDIGTHRLYIHCTETGRPTVVIDTGVGETYQSWGGDDRVAQS